MRLLLISLDAAFADDAHALLSLPHLGQLADSGVFCDRVQTIYPSITYPVHASLLTGCYPDRHGIAHNEKYLPDVPAHKRPWHWAAGDIKAETLYQAMHRTGREVASILWPTSGRNAALAYNLPEVHALPGENQVLKVMRYGTPGWLLQCEMKFGRTRSGTRQPQLDRFACQLAESLIAKQFNPKQPAGDVEPGLRMRRSHMPDMLSIHLVDLDSVRHESGVHGEEVAAALIRLDQNVGRLLHALERAGVREETIIAVVSDHGQAQVTREVGLDDWLKAAKLPARAQTLGMGAYIHVERGDYAVVYQALLENMEHLHIAHIYTRQELQRMHAAPGIIMAVEPTQGIAFVDSMEEPSHAATHGFGPEHPASQCLMWLCGPPFRQGARLATAHVVDLAPTLAYALGLPFTQAQGRVLRDAFTTEE